MSGSIDYQNQNVHVIVTAESENVNLGKISPILVAKTINDLVGSVHKVFNTKNGVKIICQKSQANLLTKKRNLENKTVNFQLKLSQNQRQKELLMVFR